MWCTQLVHHAGRDDLELRAAWTLGDVDELLRQQAAQEAAPLPVAAMEHLRVLQRHCQDVVVLACSRWIDQVFLQCRGIIGPLLSRLEAAFGSAALQNDSLWSRLGNSKHQIFMFWMKTGGHRHGRGKRKSRRMQIEAAEDEVMEEAGDPVASSSAASSSAASSDLPAGAPARVTTTSSSEDIHLFAAISDLPAGEPARVTTTLSEDRTVAQMLGHPFLGVS